MNRTKIQAGLLAATWGIFALVAAWRVWLAGAMLMHASVAQMLGAAVVHGRRMDEFVPWMAVAILLLSGPRGVGAATLRQRRTGWLLAGLLTTGIFLTALGIGADESGWFDGRLVSVAGLAVMALCTLLLSAREVGAILGTLRGAGSAPTRRTAASPGSAERPRTPPVAVTILDLWRFAAAQWGLLMVAATLYVWLTAPKESLLGDPRVGHLLFIVAAAGALPCALMAAGIGGWDRIIAASAESPAGVDLRPAARPRVRAWVLAFFFNTAAGLLLVLPAPLTALPGAVLEGVAVAFYLAGFPRIFWRGLGGKIMAAAWGLILLALAAMALERTFSARDQVVSIYYQLAWRQLWTAAAFLCLVGLATRGLECLMPSTWVTGTRRAITLGAGLFAVGVMVTTAVLLLNAAQTASAQVDVMRWLIAGAVPALLGVLVLGAVLLRAIRSC